MAAIVVTAYKIADDIVNTFCKNHAGMRVYMVTDNPRHNVPGLTCIKAPEMEVFSICQCSNIGLVRADMGGAEIIVKTDIDCIIDADAMRWIDAYVKPGKAFAFKYWGIERPDSERCKAGLLSRVMGTLAMHWTDWQRCHGYDERMRGYGYDDWDVVQRAQRAGCHVDIVQSPRIYHVNHAQKHNRTTCNPVMRDQNKAISTVKTP